MFQGVSLLVVAVLRFELSIPHATNLKEKRRVLSSILDKTRTRFGVAVAEVADQDLWQRSVIGMALVSSEGGHAREMAARVVQYVESHFEGEVCRTELELF